MIWRHMSNPLFWKKKKKNSKCHLLKFLLSMLSVKWTLNFWFDCSQWSHNIQMPKFPKWNGTLANSADPYQMLYNVASDQGLHCLLELQKVKD